MIQGFLKFLATETCNPQELPSDLASAWALGLLHAASTQHHQVCTALQKQTSHDDY